VRKDKTSEQRKLLQKPSQFEPRARKGQSNVHGIGGLVRGKLTGGDPSGRGRRCSRRRKRGVLGGGKRITKEE